MGYIFNYSWWQPFRCSWNVPRSSLCCCTRIYTQSGCYTFPWEKEYYSYPLWFPWPHIAFDISSQFLLIFTRRRLIFLRQNNEYDRFWSDFDMHPISHMLLMCLYHYMPQFSFGFVFIIYFRRAISLQIGLPWWRKFFFIFRHYISFN